MDSKQTLSLSLLDGHGNYVYCHEYIMAYINVGSQRLTHQRKIKQELSQHTVITKSKGEVSQLKLEKYVILLSADISLKWWQELCDDDDVEVRYPHEQHRLWGKTSNRVSILNDFLKFVDNNSTPNGRRADSRCSTFYFIPKFQRIKPPKPDEKDFDEKVSCCLVNEFNRTQDSEGRFTAGAYAIQQCIDRK